MNITKDSEKVICYIYKMYIEDRKDGKSKAEARRFNKNFYTNDKDLSKWYYSDISDCLLELANNGYIKIYIGGDFDILDSTIVYMENRFKNGLSDVLDLISKFIP